MTHLFCSSKFVSLNLPHLSLSSPDPFPSDNHLLVLCIYDLLPFSYVCSFILFVFLDSTCKWNHLVFDFILRFLPSILFSRPIHVVINVKIKFFFYDQIIFHHIQVIFLILTIVNNSAIGIGVYISFWIRALVFFG